MLFAYRLDETYEGHEHEKCYTRVWIKDNQYPYRKFCLLQVRLGEKHPIIEQSPQIR